MRGDLENEEKKLSSNGENPNTLDSRFPILKKPAVAITVLVITAIMLLLPIYIFFSSEKDFVGKTSEAILKTDPFRAPYVPDELIVKYRNNYTLEEINDLKKNMDALGVVSQIKLFDSDNERLKNYYVLRFKEGTDIKKIKEKLDNVPEVETAAPNTIMYLQADPHDDKYEGNQQWNMTQIKMPQAWDFNKYAKNPVTVAVVDTGVKSNHEDFRGRNFVAGYNYVNNNTDTSDGQGHGTHVAGIIGAVTDNDIGIASINWNSSVSIMPIKVLGSDGTGSSKEAAEGVRFAADHGAKVINMSVGANNINCADDPYYQAAIDYAVIDHGVTVVVAAGNSDSTTKNQPIDAVNETPASCTGVISVGSTNDDDTKRSTSDYGADVALGAPGTNILSLYTNPDYQIENGTSMASPHVAGVVAMLLSIKPDLTPAAIKTCLKSKADPYPSNFDKSMPLGAGRLNAYRVMSECSGIPSSSLPPTIVPSPTLAPTIVPSPTPVVLQYTAQGNIFLDNNGNGQKDSGEPALPNVDVSVSGTKTATGKTDAAGNYKIVIAPGTYSVAATYNGVKEITSQATPLRDNAVTINASFPFAPVVVTPTPTPVGSIPVPSPTPVTVVPTTIVKAKAKPIPTPAKTYSCHERSNNLSSNAITIGDLECTPNP